MTSYVHARLSADDRAVLEELKRLTGLSESEIVRRGLQLVARDEKARPNALELAGQSVGRFRGPHDLSQNREHLEGFGQ